MLKLLFNWMLSALSLMIVAQLIPGFTVTSLKTALVAALVVGLVNATVGLFLKIVTFPLTMVTLGVFWFVINALMLKLASAFVAGFMIDGFLPAFLGAIVLSFVNIILRAIARAGGSADRGRDSLSE
jgi:putative membrane protein